jgi:type II secretory pathway component GspD/PulD (secretin)
MRQILCRWLFVALYFLHLPAYGQRDTSSRITVNFDHAAVQDFLNSVEEQTSIHFFYDTAGFDTVRITIHASHQPLRQVLDQAFANTDIYYTVDGENHWFLTRGNAMDFSFTPGPSASETRSKKTGRRLILQMRKTRWKKRYWIE